MPKDAAQAASSEVDPVFSLNALSSIYLWMALWRTELHDRIPTGFVTAFGDLIRNGRLRTLVSDFQRLAVRSGVPIPDKWLTTSYASTITLDAPLSLAARNELCDVLGEISCALTRIEAANDAIMKPILERAGFAPETSTDEKSAASACLGDGPSAVASVEKSHAELFIEKAIATDAWMACADIAQTTGVDKLLLEKRLQRFRKKHAASSAWKETEPVSRRDAKYLYRLDAIGPIIEDLNKKKRAPSDRRNASVERLSKKILRRKTP